MMAASFQNRSVDPALTDDGPPSATSPADHRSLTGRRLVLAWIVSVAAHGVLFTTMFTLPWLARSGLAGEELAVTHTELVDASATPRTTLLETTPQLSHARPARAKPTRLAPKKFETSSVVGEPRRADLSIIGLGAGGGDFGKYGLGVGEGGAGPEFFGLGGSVRGAKRVVYVVDRSGSMIGTFKAVQDELKRSVQRLRRSMRFHVILFNSGPPLENSPRKLVHASREEKSRLAEFLGKVKPEGNTDPIPAMRLAFRANPDVIYFLTDGDFDRRLLEELRRWNKRERVRIFTIAYVNRRGGDLLQQIAQEHNGRYRFVSEYDL